MLGSQDSVISSDIYKQIVLILSCLSDSGQARVLILGKYVLLEVINTIYKHCHASVIL